MTRISRHHQPIKRRRNGRRGIQRWPRVSTEAGFVAPTRMVLIAVTSTAVIAGAAGCGTSRTPHVTTSDIATPTTSAQGSATTPSGYGPPSLLPFTGFNHPGGVAVDTAGDVYVVDGDNFRVVELAAGSNAQTVLPLTGLKNPQGVAVDTIGNVYVVDGNDKRVVELAAGSNTQTAMPFTGLNLPFGVAVDTAGAVYISDQDTKRVVKLAAD